MATLSTSAVRDNSTLANFKQWAQIISNFMATAGWTQSSDTGQVNWSTIASVPTSGNYVYEIWKPGDALTTFFFKIEYGTNGTNVPSIRVSIGTSTNGAGVLSGFISGPFTLPYNSVAVTSTSVQWNCYLAGNSGYVNIAMWVNETAVGGALYFGVARSKNSSGANTSSHVSLTTCGHSNNARYGMQTVVFGTGASNPLPGANPALSNGALPSIMTGLSSNMFGSTNVPIGPIFPAVGFYDNPLIEIATAAGGDITDQATFSIAAANMPYGVSHTYIGFKGGDPFTFFALPNFSGISQALVMLFE